MSTPAPRPSGLRPLAELLRERPALVLSGAGVSTESGIPDYRGPDSPPRDPMRYQEFVGSAEARRRYWARSYLGWPLARRARPNGGHEALARLERRGAVTGVITQNVDGLHQDAGSRTVLELHGNLAVVRCLDCGRREGRAELQERLREANPAFDARVTEVAPDGDVEIPDAWTRDFEVRACRSCGGVLKPDVVFFGENVPRERVERAYGMLDAAGALLVVGSSLTVFSGYRFVRRAAQEGQPVAILNDGPTRGDVEATLRLGGRLGELLPALDAALDDAPSAAGTPGAAGARTDGAGTRT